MIHGVYAAVAGYAIYLVFYIYTRFFGGEEDLADDSYRMLIAVQCIGIMMSVLGAFWTMTLALAGVLL